MLRPNIWVEKIEKLPCRVQGWLRLSAARTRSTIGPKLFRPDFSKMGELRRRREGGRGGGAIATESWPIWATTEYAAACLRHIQSKFYFYNRSAPAQRIFFVSVLRLIFCAPTLFAARVNALHSFYEPVPKIQI